MNISPALRNWLTRAHDTAPGEPAPGNRLSELAGPLRPAFAVVDGCSVAHHPSGPAFAALVGDKVLLPAAVVTAVLAAEPVDDLAGWVAVDAAPAKDETPAKDDATAPRMWTTSEENAAKVS